MIIIQIRHTVGVLYLSIGLIIVFGEAPGKDRKLKKGAQRGKKEKEEELVTVVPR